jgi:hypothetical protein
MEHRNGNVTEAASAASGDGSRAAAIRAALASHEEEEASLPPTPTVTEPASQVSSQDQHSRASAPQHAEGPPSKRLKGAADSSDQPQQPETPIILTESATPRQYKIDDKEDDEDGIVASLPQTPMPVVERRYSQIGADRSESPSDLSSSSRGGREASMSPINTGFVPEVPPAPPSTPASQVQTPSNRFDGLSTPLPYTSLKNAYYLEQQQQLADGGVTPAPPRTAPQPKAEPPTRARPKQSQQAPLSDDFTEWAVGKRYQLLRILGRGSYGQVAQAVDLRQGRPDAFVAIKRIQSPFDQQVDAVRLFREIHILRRLRGHECIIQLLDVVQPPSEDLDDFNDLYLVFECKLAVIVSSGLNRKEMPVDTHSRFLFIL